MAGADGTSGWRGDDVSGDGASETPAKKKTVYAQEQDAEERAAWQAEIATLDASRFLFIDEAGVTLNMARRYARAPGKCRAYGYVPRNYGTRTTLIASITPAGMGPTMTLDGAADGRAIEA